MRIATILVVAAMIAVSQSLPEGIKFQKGASSNTVLIGETTAVYGATSGKVTRVLLTHARRDVISVAAAQVIVPAAERDLFANPRAFWEKFETARFHDYAQQSTKVPVAPVRVERTVSDGDTLEADGVRVRVMATPGYTIGAVSYLIETGDKRIACTGDLIYGDGQLFDLYSLQDAVPEAKARGYHGYAARAGALIRSLRAVAKANPDIILPARGPAITDPQASINRLIERLQIFLQSHFETDALRWYWGDENHRVRSGAVERPMDILPMAEQSKLPADIVAIGNSRVILSRSGNAFVVDAGYRNLLPELRKLRDGGRLRTVEGIWITHYHDDHTDYISDVSKEFNSPVYFTQRMSEVMGKPGAFRLPCLTTKGVPISGAKRDGETLDWHEWKFTFWHFPGQTLYHGGLVAERDDKQTYLFTGDSFTPSGMDDYCMQNRVILRQGEGYEFCLRRIASLPPNTWLLNQHVEPMFRYTGAQVKRMQDELSERSAALAQLSPWPDINYMVDESWARVFPYGSDIRSGKTVELELRITNHAPLQMNYRATWNVPAGLELIHADEALTIAPRKEGVLKARVRAAGSGLHVVTADLSFADHELKQWTEALIRVR
ncbi:MAG TPA: MBL fold metallo-hydrolase [Bryobacteraceae bacterium]|nr:MBL fold metallo-hydrolase [Bryobacteraceae bacterium]